MVQTLLARIITAIPFVLLLTCFGRGYIIGECDEGLSNRLRVLLSLIHASRVLHNSTEVFMVWDINDACPGHFLQLFQPFKEVTFITNTSKALFATNASKVYPKMSMGIRLFCETYDIPYKFSLDNRLWSLLRPIRSISLSAESFAKEHHVCDITAMHVRKTDLERVLFHKKRTHIDSFHKWVASQPLQEPVYLLTDNPTTQKEFLTRYGHKKILVYQNISEEEQRPISDTTKLVLIRQNRTVRGEGIDNDHKWHANHRFTTLEHTLIDSLIAARSRKFRMSAFSSLSEYIEFMRRLYRFQWCGRW